MIAMKYYNMPMREYDLRIMNYDCIGNITDCPILYYSTVPISLYIVVYAFARVNTIIHKRHYHTIPGLSHE